METCDKPKDFKPGWRCTRAKGHPGPCALLPDGDFKTVARTIVDSYYQYGGSAEMCAYELDATHCAALAEAEKRGRMAERNQLLNDLTDYYLDLLNSRGISHPSWIGKNELADWISGRREANS
jgi:hypothetical protein